MFFLSVGEMSNGSIMFHILLFNNVSAPIRQLPPDLRPRCTMPSYIRRASSRCSRADDHVESSGSFRPDKIHGHFVVRDVDFTYRVTTCARHRYQHGYRADKITALVGLSGAGKSTMINLPG